MGFIEGNHAARWLTAVALAASLAVGCGAAEVGKDGTLVGGPCAAEGDCDEACRADSGDFPGGLCTRECATSADCPSGSACVEASGGVCLLECESDDDCREGWNCEEIDLRGGGKAKLCDDD